MSRANMVVKLADGSIRYGIYNGTSDICWRPLFDNREDAWEAWEEYYRKTWEESLLPKTPVQDAIIYSDYGGGFWFPGKASMNWLIEPTFWDDFVENMTDGRPDWLTTQILPRY